MNSVNLIGRLTHDPELKVFESGDLCLFTLAVDNRKSTLFINCSTYGERADLMAKTLRKGSLISITGRLEQRTYETQEGEKRVATYISVESFDYLEKKQVEDDKPQQKASFTAEDLAKLDLPDTDLPF